MQEIKTTPTKYQTFWFISLHEAVAQFVALCTADLQVERLILRLGCDSAKNSPHELRLLRSQV
jgi:hypothetical protein